MLGHLDRLQTVPALRPVLRRLYGRCWPLAFARAALRAPGLVRRSRWSGRRDDEARAVRALAILPAACLETRRRFPDRAEAVARELTEAVVGARNARAAEDGGLFRIADPRERWHAFFDTAVVRGPSAFNETECLAAEPTLFHVRVSRCLFADAMRELDAPELAQVACEANARFCAALLPTFGFEPRDAPTIAQGGAWCDYVWRAHPTRDRVHGRTLRRPVPKSSAAASGDADGAGRSPTPLSE
jgi:hypothetical protein